MKTVQLESLVFDFDIYPRSCVDSQHVGYIAEAIASGATMPPIVIDKRSKRVVDGFHRGKAYTRLGIKEVDVVEKTYRNDREMLLDSIRFNAGHGRALTKFDRVHCMILGDKLEVDKDALAGAMSMTVEAIGKLRVERTGSLSVGGKKQPTPLKRTIKHMAGHNLNKTQVEANKKLSGMNQMFYVNQIITLIESNLLDKSDEELMKRLVVLAGLIETELGVAS